MNQLIAQIKSLPRAFQWLLAFCVFVVAYFAAIEPVLGRTNKYNADADRIATELEAKRELRGKVADAASRVEALVGFFGQPGQPADEAARRAELGRQVNQIFGRHKVANKRESYKDLTPLMSESARTSAGAPRVGKVAVELSFECDLVTLTDIIRELEAATAVSAVPKLTIRKVTAPGGRGREATSTLQVSLTAEAWAQLPAPAPGGPARNGRNGAAAGSAAP